MISIMCLAIGDGEDYGEQIFDVSREDSDTDSKISLLYRITTCFNCSNETDNVEFYLIRKKRVSFISFSYCLYFSFVDYNLNIDV